MKTFISNLLLFLFTLSLFSQSPQKFRYQAVVRDASGNPIVESVVGIQLSILQGSSSGPAVCIEEFSPTTNEFGLITLEVGSVNTIDFETIDWSAGPYYLKVELDAAGGTSYTEMGTSQLLSVPYALHALKVSDIDGELIINNDGELPNSEYLTFQSHATDMSRIQSHTSDDLNSSLRFWNAYDGTMAEKMRLDSAGNLGIGTISPSAGLDLYKFVANNANEDIFGSKILLEESSMSALHNVTGLKIETHPGGTGWSSESYERGLHVKVRGEGDAAAVFETGNVGIGTLNPAYKLEINSGALAETAGSQNYMMRLTGHSGNTDNLLLLHRRYTDGADWHTAEIKLLKYVDATPMHYISFKGGESSARSLELGYNETPAITIDGSNRVGIGTSSPSRALDVAGDLKVGTNLTLWKGTTALSLRQDGVNSYISNKADFVGNGSTENGILYLNGQGGIALNYGAAGSSGTTKFRLNDQGNIGIGGISPSSQLDVGVSGTYSDEEPIFVVRNNHGNPVFEVYNNGIRVTVEDDPLAKGPKGGFAIGGFDPTKAGETVEFMRITPDSIRFNINNASSKGPKGGFAIGSFDRTKGGINEDFMYITPQSTDNGLYNTFLGYKAGESNGSTGTYNSFIGYEAGRNNTTGDYNTLIGYQAGKNSNNSYNTYIGYLSGTGSTNSWNTFIGYRTGVNNSGASGVFIGHEAGESNTSGNLNVFIGKNAGNSNTTGSENTYVGFGSGAANILGVHNSFFGGKSGLSSTGKENTYLGSQSMPLNSSGNYNVAVGYQTGYLNYTGSGNVFLGYKAGRSESGSNKLYIDNSSTTAPLIYGDFSTNRINLNAEVWVYGDGVENYALVTNGGTHSTRSLYVYKGAYTNGSWQTSSDIRYKKDIEELSSALDIISLIRGVRFNFNTEEFPEMEFSEEPQIGVLAQEVEKVLPELVTEDEEGYKAVVYDKLSAVLIEAVKEQQTIIEEQQNQIDELKALVEQLIAK